LPGDERLTEGERHRGGQMTVTPGVPASGLVPDADGSVWHTLRADRVLQEEKVDDRLGLSSAEAASRAQRFGPNKFDTGKAEPRWHAFIRQFADPMQIVLLVAGVVASSCRSGKPASS
jgi:magnesium-transporting ATPase (P-type)